MALSTEELLKPRFKLIADYPGNTYKIGHITYETAIASYFRKFPANFKELEWWEERKEEDMPEYLKIEDVVYKIARWERYFGWLPHEYNPPIDSDFKINYHFYKGGGLPATKEEYESQKINAHP